MGLEDPSSKNIKYIPKNIANIDLNKAISNSSDYESIKNNLLKLSNTIPDNIKKMIKDGPQSSIYEGLYLPIKIKNGKLNINKLIETYNIIYFYILVIDHYSKWKHINDIKTISKKDIDNDIKTLKTIKDHPTILNDGELLDNKFKLLQTDPFPWVLTELTNNINHTINALYQYKESDTTQSFTEFRNKAQKKLQEIEDRRTQHDINEAVAVTRQGEKLRSEARASAEVAANSEITAAEEVIRDTDSLAEEDRNRKMEEAKAAEEERRRLQGDVDDQGYG